MSKNTVTYEGLDELIDSFNQASDIVKQETRRYFKRWSDFAVKRAQIHILNAGAVDTNELIQGIHAEHSANGLESTIKPSDKADKYAAAVEYGTKPHFPPISAIEPWAERHGIPAFLVARKIAREGTEPRHFWRDTFEDLQEEVDNELSDYIDDVVRRL